MKKPETIEAVLNELIKDFGVFMPKNIDVMDAKQLSMYNAFHRVKYLLDHHDTQPIRTVAKGAEPGDTTVQN